MYFKDQERLEMALKSVAGIDLIRFSDPLPMGRRRSGGEPV